MEEAFKRFASIALVIAGFALLVLIINKIIDRTANRLYNDSKARNKIQNISNKIAPNFVAPEKYSDTWFNDFLEAWKRMDDSMKKQTMHLNEAEIRIFHDWLSANHLITNDKLWNEYRTLPSGVEKYYPDYLKWKVQSRSFERFYRYMWFNKQITKAEYDRLRHDLEKYRSLDNYQVPSIYLSEFNKWKEEQDVSK